MLTPQRGIEIKNTKVRKELRNTKIGKAAGPDAICGHTLCYCAEQLSEVFTFIFLSFLFSYLTYGKHQL